MKLIYLVLLFICLLKRFEGRKQLGVFWGANLAWKRKAEESLRSYCDRKTYDTIILTTLTRNGQTGNTDDLPSLTFANHCNDNTVAGRPGYYSYLKCPSLENQIKHCQQLGVKILLDIGSGVYHVGFSDAENAKGFAKQLWDVFLGGKYSLRTFGSADLDGINLSLRKSDSLFMEDFVKELRNIFDTQSKNGKKYLLTASPSCFLPNPILGKTFDAIPEAFDHLYVNFADKSCNINQEHKFQSQLLVWIEYAFKGPQVFVGLPSSKELQFYGDRKTVKGIIDKYINLGIYTRYIGGIILYESSWDDQNVADGKRYSQFIREIFDGKKPFVPDESNDDDDDGLTTSPTTNQRFTEYKVDTNKPNTFTKGRVIVRQRGGDRVIFYSSSCKTKSSVMLMVIGTAVAIMLTSALLLDVK